MGLFDFLKKEKPLSRQSFKGKNPYYQKNDTKAKEFLSLGGGISGIYDVSDKKTLSFVRKYSEYIESKHIYIRDKNGMLVPYFYKDRQVEKKWQKDYNKRNGVSSRKNKKKKKN